MMKLGGRERGEDERVMNLQISLRGRDEWTVNDQQH